MRSGRGRRGERRLWTTAALALALLVVAAARLLPDLPGEAPAADVAYQRVPGAERFEVERIIDGDTLVVRDGDESVTVRLFGIDTPERGERCYAEAADRLRELAAGEVQLLADVRTQDRFGRWLRYVYTTDANLIDEVLVAEGLGRAWRDDGQFRDEIIATETAAEASATGCLWAP